MRVDPRCGDFSGTTVSLALVRKNRLIVANIGDSRIVLGKRVADACEAIDFRRRSRTDSFNSYGGGSFDESEAVCGSPPPAKSLIPLASYESLEVAEATNACSMSSTSSISSAAASIISRSTCDDGVTLTDIPAGSRKRSRSIMSAEGLTVDHKPDLLHEFSRITSAGGRVFSVRYADGVVGPPRVWLGQANLPGLAMSRSIGDFVVHTAGVVSTPDISEMELDPEVDCMLIVATDGIWDHISNEEAVEVAENHVDSASAVVELVTRARARWMQQEGGSIDDITVCVVHLQGF
jgi:serine/threonine protein phosphatase PrpC